MAIAASDSEFQPTAALRLAALGAASGTKHKIRLTVILSVVLICASFAAATVLEMRRDYARALAMAEVYAGAQAQTLANETGRNLDRLAALGIAFVNAIDGSSAAEAIELAESDRILNVALADADGLVVTAIKGRPLAARPLGEDVLARVQKGRTIEPYSDPAIGSSPLTILFQPDDETPPRVIVMPLDPVSLLPTSAFGETALFTPAGLMLALGYGWEETPPAMVLRTDDGGGPMLRYVEYDGVKRIIALSSVPGWPLSAASSVRAADVLETWYGSAPLYFFVILGPAIAGAALAVLLVREFERADRARSALVAVRAINDLRSKRQEPDGENGTAGNLASPFAAVGNGADGAVRAKAEFIAHMSHELMTPLNAIIGFAQVIEGGLYGPPGHGKYVEYSGDIAAAGRELHERIRDILAYASAETEPRPLERAPVDLEALISASVEQFRAQALNRHISLNFKVTCLPPARADAAAVKRILTIILSNALRYTPDRGAIYIEARKKGDTVVLEVRDNGQGFTPEEAARVGEPFVRFMRAGVENGGLGLGLAMAMNLARRMGGALRLAGAAGEGTWVKLRLPIQ